MKVGIGVVITESSTTTTSSSASGPSILSHKRRAPPVHRRHVTAAALRTELAPLLQTLASSGHATAYEDAEVERERAAESLTARFDSLPTGHSPSLVSRSPAPASGPQSFLAARAGPFLPPAPAMPTRLLAP